MAYRFEEPESLPTAGSPLVHVLGHRSPLPDEPSLADLLATLGARPGGPAKAGLERRRHDGVTHHVVQPARPGRHAPWPSDVNPFVREALARRGIREPWAHQARAMRSVLEGEDVIVVTPTASGKSLCYSAPLVSRFLRDPDARALLVFPTKALALDQAQAIHELVRDVRALDPSAHDIPVATFDGDTPADVRRTVRQRGRLVITNPDVLHAGILPHHARWAALFQGLTHVVIDEIHVYRGVFGSHVANVLRRLLRVAAFHGSRPSFVTCSATIANPAEHARALLGRPAVLVDDDAAPRGERHVVFYNPPVVDAELGLRASAVGSTRRLATRTILAGLQTIVFATSRLQVEVLTRYLKDQLTRRRRSPELVEAYRGGYLPNVRRETQRRLRDGSLRGVVATHALELGVDVGSLDVAILCGYPGSIASTRQQMGRAGRRGKASACVLVARANPLDQHVVTHPETVLGAPCEHARLDADNLLILSDHVKCAAFELPFRRGERFGGLDGGQTAELLGVLAEDGLVHEEGGTWHWTQETHPAEAVSLRSVSSDNFVVVDTSVSPPRVIAEVDFPSAPTTIHEKAIYMVGSRLHQVDRLDHEGRKAYVTPVDCDYYTDAISYRTVSVLESFERRPAAASDGADASALVHHGEVRVTRKAIGFKKIKFYTSENLGYGDVVIPEQEMHTTSYWITVGRPALARLADSGFSRREVVEGMAGAAHAMHAMACLLASCDRRDLETAVGDARGAGTGAPAWSHAASVGEGPRIAGAAPGHLVSLEDLECFEPTIYLYDNVPGGVGFSPLLFDRHSHMVAMSRDIVERCACRAGCPGCVGPREDLGLRCREAALAILDELCVGASVREARSPAAS